MESRPQPKTLSSSVHAGRPAPRRGPAPADWSSEKSSMIFGLFTGMAVAIYLAIFPPDAKKPESGPSREIAGEKKGTPEK